MNLNLLQRIKPSLAFPCGCSRSIHTTSVVLWGKHSPRYQAGAWPFEFPDKLRGRYRWRREGPIIDLPDWTFLDGRPAPLQIGQLDKKLHDLEMGKRMVNTIKQFSQATKAVLNKEEMVKQERAKYLRSRPRSKADPSSSV